MGGTNLLMNMNNYYGVLVFGMLIGIVGVLYTGQIYLSAKWERDVLEDLSPEKDPTLDKIPILLEDIEERDVIIKIVDGLYEREAIAHDILIDKNNKIKTDALLMMIFWIMNLALYTVLVAKLRRMPVSEEKLE